MAIPEPPAADGSSPQQRKFDQDEAEDAAHDMGVGPHDEHTAAVDLGARKSRVVVRKICHKSPVSCGARLELDEALF